MIDKARLWTETAVCVFLVTFVYCYPRMLEVLYSTVIVDKNVTEKTRHLQTVCLKAFGIM